MLWCSSRRTRVFGPQRASAVPHVPVLITSGDLEP
jgi:hypothetical protein